MPGCQIMQLYLVVTQGPLKMSIPVYKFKKPFVFVINEHVEVA